MSQERRLISTVSFDKKALPVEKSKTGAKKPGLLSLVASKFRKKPAEIVQFEQAVADMGVDLAAELTRTPLVQERNTPNIVPFPIRIKQVEDLHEYDDAQFEKTLMAFQQANLSLPHNQKLSFEQAADNLKINNIGKVVDFESEKAIDFSQVPREEAIRSDEDSLMAYQVVAETPLIYALPVGSTLDEQMAIVRAEQSLEVVNEQVHNNAISSIVVIRRKQSQLEASVQQKIDTSEQKEEIHPIQPITPVVEDRTQFISNVAPSQIQRLDLSEKIAS